MRAAARKCTNIVPNAIPKGRSLHTIPVQKNTPKFDGGTITTGQAQKRMARHVVMPRVIQADPKALPISQAADVLGCNSTDGIPEAGMVSIAGQEYRILLRGERFVPDVQDPQLDTGLRELSQDTSTTVDPNVAVSFSNYTHGSTMAAVNKKHFPDKYAIGECLDKAISRFIVFFVPVNMPLPMVTGYIYDATDMGNEQERILPKGTVVDISRKHPDSFIPDCLPEAIQSGCERMKSELIYARCLPEAESIQVRAGVKEK